MSARLPLLLALAAASACTCQGGAPPVIEAVTPASFPVDRAVQLEVKGAHFEPLVVADLDRPGSSSADAAFEVSLRSGSVRVPLRVLRVSERRIVVHVQALAAAPGSYDVEVTDPRGRRAALAAAVTVEASGCLGLADGTPCDDGDACTRTDACSSGACLGSGPVLCPSSDACHVDGACDPAIGPASCVPRPASDGSGCDDGDLCTEGDSCRSGVCEPGSPKVCAATDGCHESGTCDPGTGTCTYPPVTDGTPCDLDADACTPDSCRLGACSPGARRTCSALDECHQAGACDPGTGECSDPPAADGSPCGPAPTCDAAWSCSSGTCAVQVRSGLPPRACLAATPAVAEAGAIEVELDAACSTGIEPGTELRFLFDEATGAWDTDFSSSLKARHVYPAPGVFEAAVEARSACGLSAFARTAVVVTAPGGDLVVTTGADESDAGATPAAPGGTGLSLREAVNHVNGTGRALVIRFAGSVHQVALGSGLPALTASGAAIVGRPDVTLDFAGASLPGSEKACVELAGSAQAAYHLRVSRCAGTSMLLSGAGARIEGCTVSTSPGTNSRGILAVAQGVIGPGNDVSGADLGIGVWHVRSAGVEVIGNRVHGCTHGIQIWDVFGALVRGNASFANSNAGIEVWVASTTSVLHNTAHGNGNDGVEVDNKSTSALLRNNLLTGNAGFGINLSPQATVTAVDHNGFQDNASGDLNGAKLTADSMSGLDPLYVDATAGDLRLRPGSPAVDRGLDMGLDVNGPLSGDFGGAAPDLGAEETP